MQAASTTLIQRLSGPRLQNEFLVLLAERDPVRAIARLEQLKLLRFFTDVCITHRTYSERPRLFTQALAWWAHRFPIL